VKSMAYLKLILGNAPRTVVIQLIRSSDGIVPRSLCANCAQIGDLLKWPLFVGCGQLITRLPTR